MLSGVGLALSEVPLKLLDEPQLQGRVYERGGERELQCLIWEKERVLPVWLGGQLQIVRWGKRRGESKVLPCTAWTTVVTLEKGGWANIETVEVVIPATVALDRGVWFRVREGVRGLVVRDELDQPVVYPLVQPATHYYQVMTRSPWMPALVGDLI